MPEVSIVAILDADKEGFLRSTRSLIQTIGRAARNLNGMAILYAEKITDSMKQAIDETNRRRQKQDLYNKIHGITPKALNKKVIDIMELEVEGDEVTKNKDGIEVKVKPKVNMNDPKAIVDYMNLLREKMKDAAKSLKFEEAAKYRDEIKELDNILKSME